MSSVSTSLLKNTDISSRGEAQAPGILNGGAALRRITTLVALAIIILTILMLSVGDRSIQGISVGRVLTYIISVLSVVLPVLLVIRVGRYVWTSWQGAGQRWRDAGAAWAWKRKRG